MEGSGWNSPRKKPISLPRPYPDSPRLPGIGAPPVSSVRPSRASLPANPCVAVGSPPFPPGLAASPHAEKRIRRMVHGETTTRSPFDADDVIARLRARGVAQLRDERAIWVILDGSDLRKPYAREMESLQRVKRLSGGGM